MNNKFRRKKIKEKLKAGPTKPRHQ